jgi:hypothetical protein
MKIYIFFSFLFLAVFGLQAQTAKIYGVIENTNGNPIADVHITSGDKKAVSDINGEYDIEVLASKKIKVKYTSVNHITYVRELKLFPNEEKKINIVLDDKVETIGTIELEEKKDDRLGEIKEIEVRDIDKIAGANQGVEGLIKSLSASTTTNNELSSQYSVRGGNFDENLVYVNGLEIYRPFLVRSGKQEGLSFINSDMVESIRFSAGGFTSEFGDKLSSVLDITYKKADTFSLKSNFSFQDVGLTVATPIKIKKNDLSFVGSIRYKNPAFLLRTLDTDADYRPRFIDAQLYLDYPLSATSSISFLGNYSNNQYKFIPTVRRSSFGTVQQAKQVVVHFNGQEIDNFENANMALQWSKYLTENTKISFQGTHFRTLEQEFFDLQGDYILGVVDNNAGSPTFGEITQVSGVGSYLDHARNQFFGQVSKVNHRGEHKVEDKNAKWKWGADWQYDQIDDRLDEWRYIDSLGFNDNDQADVLNMELDKKVFAKNKISSHRAYGFIQYGRKLYNEKKSQFWAYNLGVRGNYWSLNKEFFVTPRAQVSVKPDWEKDMVFKLSSGLYYQSPFYREMRDFNGKLNKDIQSQKSFQTTVSNEYAFKMFNRPFMMSTELYYKNLWDVIPYEIENLQVRYYAHNNAKAYSAGLEWRLNGELVKGSQSYVSLAVMKTAEDIEGDKFGYIPKPTDRRFAISIFYQDHLNRNEDIRFSLAATYASGLPVGGENSIRSSESFRIPAYRRVDIAFSKALKKPGVKKTGFLKNVHAVWVSAEVLNLLDIQNTQSYLWVKDALNQEFAVPNYLTGRLLNLKLNIEI